MAEKPPAGVVTVAVVVAAAIGLAFPGLSLVDGSGDGGWIGSARAQTGAVVRPLSEGAPEAPKPGEPTPGVSPVAPAGDRPVYFPNTEALAPDEVRVITCGSAGIAAGRGQSGSCWLVELGNGEKILIDVGYGAAVTLAGLGIAYDFLDKVFLTSLKSEAIADLAQLHIGGWISGRSRPLRLWGPTGAQPSKGTAVVADHLRNAMAADLDSNAGRLPGSGAVIEVHEFDYGKDGEVVYQGNGVVVRSWPAIDVIDGSVSYSVEWNGRKVAIGGPGLASKWYVRHAKGADLAVHRSAPAAETLIERLRMAPGDVRTLVTREVAAPAAFGKLMSEVRPRMAVAAGIVGGGDVAGPLETEIRTAYGGPLSLALGPMAWTITREAVRARALVAGDGGQAVPAPRPALIPQPPSAKDRREPSPWLRQGALDVDDVLRPIIERINKQYGLPPAD
jgi:ribonuclease Z